VVTTQLASMTNPARPLPSSENVKRVECVEYVGLRAYCVLWDVCATAPSERLENAKWMGLRVSRGQWDMFTLVALSGRFGNIKRMGLRAQLRLYGWLPVAPPERSGKVKRVGL
jgi:hypothetical protein